MNSSARSVEHKNLNVALLSSLCRMRDERCWGIWTVLVYQPPSWIMERKDNNCLQWSVSACIHKCLFIQIVPVFPSTHMISHNHHITHKHIQPLFTLIFSLLKTFYIGFLQQIRLHFFKATLCKKTPNSTFVISCLKDDLDKSSNKIDSREELV